MIQQALYSTSGTIGTGSLAITAQGSPNMTVNAAAGWCAIVGNGSPNLGAYVAYNNATTILTITTADATNPRIDRVVVTINDAAYSGSTNNVVFTVIAGTPAASPTAPATPSNSISLATIAVAANATSISSGNITDTRATATSNLIATAGLPAAGGSLTGNLTLAAGTTAISPLRLTSGTNLTTTTGGTFEYDGNVVYQTPNYTATNTTNGGRGLVPTRYFYGLSADKGLLSGGSATSNQSLFGVGIPLAASTTYEVEISARFTATQTATATTYTITLGFSSAPTGVSGNTLSAGPTFAALMNVLTTTSPFNFVAYTSAASALTFTVPIIVKALIRTNAATTFTPQIILNTSASTALTTLNGSFVKVTPVGNSTATTIGAWA